MKRTVTNTKTTKAKVRKPGKATIKAKPKAKSRPKPKAKLRKAPRVPTVQPEPTKVVYASRWQRLGLSLVLLLCASTVSSSVVLASTQDMKRAEQEAAEVMQTMMQPKEYLYLQATAHGLDYDVLHRIAYCESNWRMVKSPISSAYGFFQIIDRTERYTPQYKAGGRKYDAFTNIDMAVYLNDKYGTFPWMESRPCWKWTAEASE